MLLDDTYKTITAPAEGIFRDKGSKFIAFAFPLRSEEEFKDILSRIKSGHPKARHYCWAWRLTPDKSVSRSNDDGEPSGSAGLPILNILLSFDVTNIAVIVVRYFGGTLLGIPGLIHAYKTAATEALNHSEIIERSITDYYNIEFDYSKLNQIMKLIKEKNLRINNQKIDNHCLMEIEIRKDQVNKVINNLKKIPGLSFKLLYTK